MPSSQANGDRKIPKLDKEPVKLVLCFDGTGNKFGGSESDTDTNVVKLLKMLDRTHPDQYHYYQTGIGTYDIDVNDSSLNKSWLGEIKSFVSRTVDQGYATTFDAHVMAGYRFLMRYYKSGAKIYMFGFSRGAYTAKFLARMISTVGLLCKGNEEMVPFAYLLYQRYLSGELKVIASEESALLKKSTSLTQLIEDKLRVLQLEQLIESFKATLSPQQISHLTQLVHSSRASPPGERARAAAMQLSALKADQLGAYAAITKQLEARRPAEAAAEAVQLVEVKTVKKFLEEERLRRKESGPSKASLHYDESVEALQAFSKTFCREEIDESGKGENIKVYFLGIWDCVSSVAVLEQKAPIPVEVLGTAHYVRHAVSVDERRVKFKPSLLSQDIYDAQYSSDEDIKEVWFPGCHSDVGGGCSLRDDRAASASLLTRLWRRVKRWDPRGFNESAQQQQQQGVKGERLALSDISLAWMMHELQHVAHKDERFAVKRNPTADAFLDTYRKWMEGKDWSTSKGFVHDSLSFGFGTGFFGVLCWNFLEHFPFLTRWELRWTASKPLWENVRFPLNGGRARDVPFDAELHESLVGRLKTDRSYAPQNCNGRGTLSCLQRPGSTVQFAPVPAVDDDDDNAAAKHQTYNFVHVARPGGSDQGLGRFRVFGILAFPHWVMQVSVSCVGKVTALYTVH